MYIYIYTQYTYLDPLGHRRQEAREKKERPELVLFVSWFCYMGGCQNYGPFLRTLNIKCRIIIGTKKGTIILTTTHMSFSLSSLNGFYRGIYRVIKGNTGSLDCSPYAK